MIFLRLFWSFFKIGVLGFGGGYAFLPLIQEESLAQGFLTGDEFSTLLALAEMTPGPLALNTASFVGMKTAGWAGALLASVSVTLPGVLACLILLWLTNLPRFDWWRQSLQGLRPTLVALILYAAARIVAGDWLEESRTAWKLAILSGSILAAAWFKAHPALVVLGAGVLGAAMFFVGVTI